MNNNFETFHSFSDYMFKPQYSETLSRSDLSTSVDMGKFKLDLPLISANMKDITENKMAVEIAKYGGLGVLHRFMSVEENLKEYNSAVNELNVSDDFCGDIRYAVGISIGVNEEEKIRFQKLYEAGARLFCIDVAHGHHVLVKNMLKWIRENYPDEELSIIAGNIATHEAAHDLTEWGADILKVGIGPGSACQTRQNTGAGVPQLGALMDIWNNTPILKQKDIKIIADGGIKISGDIAKALVYSHAVMVGSYVAGTSETPGHVYENQDGKFYKVYGGSASGERKTQNGGKHKFVEGMVKTVEFRGHVKYIFRKTKENLQSSLSYNGCKDLEELKTKAILIKISSGGKSESKL
jgi:IMP dehydrogenase